MEYFVTHWLWMIPMVITFLCIGYFWQFDIEDYDDSFAVMWAFLCCLGITLLSWALYIGFRLWWWLL